MERVLIETIEMALQYSFTHWGRSSTRGTDGGRPTGLGITREWHVAGNRTDGRIRGSARGRRRPEGLRIRPGKAAAQRKSSKKTGPTFELRFWKLWLLLPESTRYDGASTTSMKGRRWFCSLIVFFRNWGCKFSERKSARSGTFGIGRLSQKVVQNGRSSRRRNEDSLGTVLRGRSLELWARA